MQADSPETTREIQKLLVIYKRALYLACQYFTDPVLCPYENNEDEECRETDGKIDCAKCQSEYFFKKAIKDCSK